MEDSIDILIMNLFCIVFLVYNDRIRKKMNKCLSNDLIYFLKCAFSVKILNHLIGVIGVCASATKKIYCLYTEVKKALFIIYMI